MLGSTIIWEKDPSRLAAINSVDDLDHLVHVDLETMTSLDFESLAAKGKVEWSEGEPIQFDADGGMGIFKISEQGLAYVISHARVPKDLKEDVQRLASFIDQYGSSHIYEFATF